MLTPLLHPDIQALIDAHNREMTAWANKEISLLGGGSIAIKPEQVEVLHRMACEENMRFAKIVSGKMAKLANLYSWQVESAEEIQKHIHY